MTVLCFNNQIIPRSRYTRKVEIAYGICGYKRLCLNVLVSLSSKLSVAAHFFHLSIPLFSFNLPFIMKVSVSIAALVMVVASAQAGHANGTNGQTGWVVSVHNNPAFKPNTTRQILGTWRKFGHLASSHTKFREYAATVSLTDVRQRFSVIWKSIFILSFCVIVTNFINSLNTTLTTGKTRYRVLWNRQGRHSWSQLQTRLWYRFERLVVSLHRLRQVLQKQTQVQPKEEQDLQEGRPCVGCYIWWWVQLLRYSSQGQCGSWWPYDQRANYRVGQDDFSHILLWRYWWVNRNGF